MVKGKTRNGLSLFFALAFLVSIFDFCPNFPTAELSIGLVNTAKFGIRQLVWINTHC